MRDDTDNSEDVRDLLPAAAFLSCMCVIAVLVLVDQIGALAAGDKPSRLVIATLIAIGAALGRTVPLLPSEGPRPGSGPSVSVALLLTSGVVAIVGLRDRFPSGRVMVMAFVVGLSAVMATRMIARQFRKARKPDA